MDRAPFITDEYYHVYNRGVDKRNIFSNSVDVLRFYERMGIFNTTDPVGSVYEFSFEQNKKDRGPKIVEFVAFCLNPNHFHFILQQKVDKGISEYMKRLLGGYTKYFNNKEKRIGSLFQGTFKSKHITDNDYLLHASAYVNLNNRVHSLGSETSKWVRSSWEEYVSGAGGICEKEMILGQFGSAKEYEEFALSSLELSLEKKKEDKELAGMLLEDF